MVEPISRHLGRRGNRGVPLGILTDIPPSIRFCIEFLRNQEGCTIKERPWLPVLVLKTKEVCHGIEGNGVHPKGLPQLIIDFSQHLEGINHFHGFIWLDKAQGDLQFVEATHVNPRDQR